MAKGAKASVALNEFERCLDSAFRIYGAVREQCVYGHESINEGIGPAVAQKIVGQAFVGMVAAWEDFLESAFLRYMTGAPSGSGYCPTLRLGPCSSLNHAKQVLGCDVNITAASRRMRWGESNWVADVANIFFEGDHRFDLKRQPLQMRLEIAYAIRNRVVHNSGQAKKRFKEAANRLTGAHPSAPLPHGFSPGRLLTLQGPTACFDTSWLNFKTDTWGDLFEAYYAMFYDESGLITPL